jgi:ABC-2 type transport system permease protein
MVHVPTVYRWELRKLVSQKRTYLGLGAAMGVPIIFVVALALQRGQPNDVAFGRYVRESGLAIPPVILIFGSYWLFPLITALVAGDIVAAEEHNGTLKTILTRSVSRGQVFAAKTLAAFSYAALALVIMGVTAVVAGIAKSGYDPLVSLSGTIVSPTRALGLIAASLAFYLMPLIAVASIALLLSTVTHNSAAAVVGALLVSLLLQLTQIIPGLDTLQPYLLPAQFNAWQGLLRTPVDWVPIVRAAWVCALHALPCLAVALTVFARQDVAGG